MFETEPQPAKSSQFRWFVATVAAIAGIVTAVAEHLVAVEAMTPQERGLPGQPDTPEMERLAFVCCAVFYSVTYSVGRLIYGFFGAKREAQEVRGTSNIHLTLLNAVCLVWLCFSGWKALQNAFAFRPSMIAISLGVLATVWDFWRDGRARADEADQLFQK